MSNVKLNINFLWHMHQPFYKNLANNDYIMPWVRLHGIKDYYDMVAILEPFPNIHQTFNLVPSLIEQIQDYANNNAQDKLMKLTSKPANQLSSDDKIEILSKLFMANWETMVKIYPRYRELLKKRGENISVDQLKVIKDHLTTQDFLDLQVWYNLAWFDPIFKHNDKELIELINKDKNFNEEDKKVIIKKQIDIMKNILPVYKKFMDKGQIEVSISPFYHPILPLLIDNSIARISSPYINLPKEFKHPEDAKWQVEKAVEYYKDIFGCNPKGMWPSEGSVSDEIIPIIADAGIRWIATDEKILEASINRNLRNYSGEVIAPDVLYKSYLIEKNNREMNIIFRDIKLSDKIGFIYSKWNPDEAVNDFMFDLYNIRNKLKYSAEKHIVNIILDGENAWEYYPDDGRDFLLKLYERLSNEDNYFSCVTVSEYIDSLEKKDKIHSIFPGSWINCNYDIWIGHHEDNLAWDYLNEARKKLVEFQNENNYEKNQENIDKAWKEIYIAEGSDWCWWYGDDHSSENDIEFDNLFRQHLINMYRLINSDVPHYLFLPISKKYVETPHLEPVAFINPEIDGKSTHYYEWLSAGFYDTEKIGGAMHQSETNIRGIYYGYNDKNIYLRIDPKKNFLINEWNNTCISINILKPKHFKIDIYPYMCEHLSNIFMYEEKHENKWEQIGEIKSIAIDKSVEIEMPINLLQIKRDYEIVEFFIHVIRNNLEIEHWPLHNPIKLVIQPEDYETLLWKI